MKTIKTNIEDHNVLITIMDCTNNWKDIDELHNGYFNVDIYIDNKHTYSRHIHHCVVGTDFMDAVELFIGFLRIEMEDKEVKNLRKYYKSNGEKKSKRELQDKAYEICEGDRTYKLLNMLQSKIMKKDVEVKEIEL